MLTFITQSDLKIDHNSKQIDYLVNYTTIHRPRQFFLRLSRLLTTVLSDDNYTLQIREFPTFKSLYELKVSSFCRILNVAWDQENPLFVEGSFQNEEDCENRDISNIGQFTQDLQMLRIRGICEGNPKARLVRLIARQKFGEAEKFAKLNNLPTEDIFKSKAVYLVNELANQDAKSNQQDIFNDLEQTLLKLSDKDFMVKCCLNAIFQDLKMTRKMLMIARKNLGNQDVTDVNKALHRLDTFIFVHGLKIQNDLESWILFSKSNMLEEMKKLLEQEQVDQALIIWNRHQTELLLDQISILEILNALPRSTTSKMSFLNKFIPDCLALTKNQKNLSEVIELIARWILLTTTSIEVDFKNAWPQIGIDFAQTMLDAFEVQPNGSEDELGLTRVRIPLMLQAHKNQKVRRFFLRER